MSVMFAFKKIDGESLEQTALRACAEIISAGIGIQGGKICEAKNNVMAKNAVEALSDVQLHKFSTWNRSGINTNIAEIFIYYKEYLKTADVKNLEHVAMAAIGIKSYDETLLANAKPTNFDLNGASAMLFSYVEPTGIALRFAQAFDMLPPSSPNKKFLPWDNVNACARDKLMVALINDVFHMIQDVNVDPKEIGDRFMHHLDDEQALEKSRAIGVLPYVDNKLAQDLIGVFTSDCPIKSYRDELMPIFEAYKAEQITPARNNPTLRP